ncbi:MAG: DUF481 domain-containing protein [Verrucomicrobiota bacterium]
MMMRQTVLVLLILVLEAATIHAASSIVTMRSGERLIGEVLPGSDTTTLVLKSALLGELKLPRNEVISEEALSAAIAAKPQPAPAVAPSEPQIAAQDKNLVLTEEEVAHIEERRLIEQFQDLKTPDSWSGTLRVGMNFSDGDSKWSEAYAKGNLIIDPEGSRNYYRISGSYTYRETERGSTTVKSTDRYDGNLTYRRDFSERIFLQGTAAGRVDRIKGIERELQGLVGAGVRLKPIEDMEFIVGGGGGAEELDVDFQDTRSGVNPVANVFQEVTWKPSKKITLAQEFNYFINPEEGEQYNYILTAAFRYRLTDLFGLEFSYNENFDNDVGNGNIKDDIRWRNALVVYF